ncbi:MAG: hypothetical protein U9R58_02205 [Chloroflexota bacterium]|nr:hypothetical protein [Chloroflexota bacterium]
MLTRWDPLQEMMGLRSAMDRLFDSAITGTSGWETATRLDLA